MCYQRSRREDQTQLGRIDDSDIIAKTTFFPEGGLQGNDGVVSLAVHYACRLHALCNPFVSRVVGVETTRE